MTFLAPLALLALGLLLGPLVAHALRRGRSRTIAFPATRFVPKHQATTKERRRLQDQWLLAIRILSLVCLALLGATPLASCSRLSLERDRGASVAVLLVIDDSGSMQVEDDGVTRQERALDAARELLVGTRSGDAVGIALAGRPARLLLPPTTDLGRAKGALSEVGPTDRPTDLSAAVLLAQDALASLPQTDKQIVILSDQATPRPLPTTASVQSIPLVELARPFENCALLRAAREPGQVRAEVACTPAAAQGRKIELLAGDSVIRATDLAETAVLPLADDAKAQGLRVRLSAPLGSTRDQAPSDDAIDVEPRSSSFVIGLCADAKRSGLPTSGSTVIKVALDALAPDSSVDPVTVLPDHAAELEHLAVLLIDDPPGLTPEASSALETFVKGGGVVLTMLGAEVAAAPLGSVFAPLVVGAPAYSNEVYRGVDIESAGPFGQLAGGWSDLEASGRVALPEQPTGTRVLLRFADGQPLVLERPLERGLFITTLLPSSVAVSDFALRPAFLALLDRVLYEARLRGSSAATEVGQPWEVPEGTLVTGPGGRLPATLEDGRWLVTPDRAGKYSLRVQGKETARFALRTAEEATLQPSPRATTDARAKASGRTRQKTDISREVALALLLLLLVELGMRVQRSLPRAA